LSNLGNAFKDQGRLDEAIVCYERALAANPADAAVRTNLLFLRAIQPNFDIVRYIALGRGRELASETHSGMAPVWRFRPQPLAGRRLRLGYVSGEYRYHAVSYFIEQIFAAHDRERVEVFAYSASPWADKVTERLQAHADHWVPLAGLSDSAARDRIRADAIDVLVDLSGHTACNRLGIFTLRSAPVQAHYLGFVTTGLSQMDYFIGDEIATPRDTDTHFCEQVWRLPRVWVTYDAKGEAPSPGWRPAGDRTVCLGSFNHLSKLTKETVVLWGRVLRALPEARLLLKARVLGDPGVRRRILDSFEDQDVNASRIELADGRATAEWGQHMAYYDRLDIALDPVVGLGGGTTTLDALWMGVPVITLAGARMATRMTVSCLHAIGRPEWIAHDEQEYVDKVVALARDVDGRKAMRYEQRTRMAASPLCDAAGLARTLEDAFTAMFERWMDTHHP